MSRTVLKVSFMLPLSSINTFRDTFVHRPTLLVLTVPGVRYTVVHPIVVQNVQLVLTCIDAHRRSHGQTKRHNDAQRTPTHGAEATRAPRGVAGTAAMDRMYSSDDADRDDADVHPGSRERDLHSTTGRHPWAEGRYTACTSLRLSSTNGGMSAHLMHGPSTSGGMSAHLRTVPRPAATCLRIGTAHHRTTNGGMSAHRDSISPTDGRRHVCAEDLSHRRTAACLRRGHLSLRRTAACLRRGHRYTDGRRHVCAEVHHRAAWPACCLRRGAPFRVAGGYSAQKCTTLVAGGILCAEQAPPVHAGGILCAEQAPPVHGGNLTLSCQFYHF